MIATAGLPELLAALALAAAVLAVPGLAGAVALRRLWWHAPHLAPAAGLLATGLAGFTVFAAWLLAPGLGAATGWAVLALGCGGLVVAGGRREPSLGSLLRGGLPLVLATSGLVVAVAGLLLLWGGPTDLFSLARVRFSHPLPMDNELPAVLADRLLSGADPRTPIGGWLSSDRPPLQSGLILQVSGVTGWTGIDPPVQAFATGLLLQVTWMPAAYSVTRALGFSRWAGLAGALVTALAGSQLVNTAFTWPKLLSAAFVLAAMALSLDLAPAPPASRWTVPAVAALCAMGLLSHGAALFALPVLLFLLWRARRALRPAPLAAAAAAGALLYTPWLVYQRWYDPPGDRLLKWHLAGVVELDDRSFPEALRDAYSELSFATLVEHKLENLALPFQLPFLGPGPELGTSAEAGVVLAVRAAQFVTISGAVGLSWFPLLGLVAGAVAGRGRDRAPGPAGRSCAVLAAALAAVLLWCLVMFGPGTTYVHHGTHVPILLAGSLPVAWLADRRPSAALGLGAAQVAVLATCYLPYAGGPLHLGAAGAVAGGTVLGALALVATRWSPASGAGTPADGGAADGTGAAGGTAPDGAAEDHRSTETVRPAPGPWEETVRLAPAPLDETIRLTSRGAHPAVPVPPTPPVRACPPAAAERPTTMAR